MPQTKKSHYHHLKEKWTARHKKLQETLWAKHGESLNWFSNNVKQLATSSAAALMFLSTPHQLALPKPPVVLAQNIQTPTPEPKYFLISDLARVLPKEVRPLTLDEEKNITSVLSRDFKLTITAELEGKRLERNYGLIGKEQHLARYPGDTIASHFDNNDDAQKFAADGMAPGLGAWGYIGDSTREKYYIAVQIFLSKDFNSRFSEYRDFYKFRKMLVVNPQNGKALVVDIADAGPSPWTGKHLGGSPEVMDYLERQDGAQKGPVLFFFIDDRNDKVPLGPIEL